MNRNAVPQVERRVTLCYIRLSQTKNESNLQAACDKYGWISEWYADADKHKTGTKENNRPQWLLLKQHPAPEEPTDHGRYPAFWLGAERGRILNPVSGRSVETPGRWLAGEREQCRDTYRRRNLAELF